MSARMQQFSANCKADLIRFREAEIEFVEVFPANDSCSACLELRNIRFKLDKAPELPFPECIRETGCWCTLIAVLG